MKTRMEYGLPIATSTFPLRYKKTVENVLVDPGCVTTIFDIDVLAKVGINNNLCLLCDKYVQSLTEVK
ncbi:hypothetical protein EXW58_22610 [Bacillus mycoides]|uniref:hypothetical protein n=1 Tax=Bacillus mycoides TaxID=1405 RepID=UPI001C01FC32|nr:hypothetical protein [Bacillus mycoides]QWG30206.1 hypothetical protein EXW58_22610 [Bacillus mycoides]